MHYKYTDKEVILFDHILDLVGGSAHRHCPTQSIFQKLIPLEIQRKTGGKEKDRIKIRISQALERIIEDGNLELSGDKKTLSMTEQKGVAFYEKGGYASDRDRFESTTEPSAKKVAFQPEPQPEVIDWEKIRAEIKSNNRSVFLWAAIIAAIVGFVVAFLTILLWNS